MICRGWWVATHAETWFQNINMICGLQKIFLNANILAVLLLLVSSVCYMNIIPESLWHIRMILQPVALDFLHIVPLIKTKMELVSSRMWRLQCGSTSDLNWITVVNHLQGSRLRPSGCILWPKFGTVQPHFTFSPVQFAGVFFFFYTGM